MRTARLAALFTSIPLLVIACAVPAVEEEESRRDRSSKVINGTASAATDDAVVLLTIGQGICTGTLIAPNLVLTARHCVSEAGAGQTECSPFGADKAPGTIGVALGAQPSSANAVARGTRLFVEPNATICGQDIALVLLDKAVPNIAPREVRLTPPVVGELTTAVGYGQDENEQLTGRKSRSGIAVQAVGPAARTATAQGQTLTVNVPANDFMTGESVCFGDSGGPLFDAKGAVLGTTSRGTPLGCVGAPALFSSNAAHAGLIRAALVAAGHPLAPATDGGVEAGADTGAPAPAPDAGASADAGPIVVASEDAGKTKPDEISTPGGDEEDEPTDADETSTDDDDDDDDEGSKPKKKKPSSSVQRATGSADPGGQQAASCAASPAPLASSSVAPFLLALAALASSRRRRASTRRG